MRNVSQTIKSKVGLLAAVVLAAGAGGLAPGLVRAAVPDSSGSIHACYASSDGSLKIIDSSTQSCGSGETALNWDKSNGLETIPPGADLSDAQLTYRKLENADLSRVNFNGTILVGTDFTGANLSNTDFTDTTANNINLTGANVSNIILTNGVIKNSKFVGLDLTTATFPTSISSSDLSNSNLSGVDLSGSTLHGDNFTDANLSGVTFAVTDLSGSDLSSADLSGAIWDGGSTCPDHTTSAANGNTCVGHLTP